jgi:ppGpp synthetase/RelA/SpoT-type nucleotidyltranferase
MEGKILSQKLKYTAKQFFDMTDKEFKNFYESSPHQKLVDYLETRIRLEILEIIRRFELKGEVFFEIRQKSTVSAYAKLQKEIFSRQEELGNSEVYLFQIIKDIVGARIICLHEEIQKRVFDYMLQIESLVIQPEGLEFYSAPFRDYTLSKDIHDELSQSIASVASALSPIRDVTKKSKPSNYESLHFYVQFSSQVDIYLLKELTDHKASIETGQQVREAAEGKYLLNLFEQFSKEEASLTQMMPIEFQIRTITDHLWAQEEHKYIYKNTSLPAGTTESQRVVEVLKNAFVGLKFAYYNVERLRSLVRKVSSSKVQPEPKFTGSSKDINSIRFTFFTENRHEIEGMFAEADRNFADAVFDLEGSDGASGKIIESIRKLYSSVHAASNKKTSTFDVRAWGKERLFYLFLAYVVLFSKNRKLTPALTMALKNEIELTALIGNTAFQATVHDDKGSLKLATKLYERIETFDRITRTLIIENDDNPLTESEALVFKDPLVGIRLASSFFLQEEFSGAVKALRGTFSLGGEAGLTSWYSLALAQDFSLSEILMRYSQYIFFESFEDEDKLVDNYIDLQDAFDCIFGLDSSSFNPELYRSYCWYHSMTNYLLTQSAFVPEGIRLHGEACQKYLLRHHAEAMGDEIRSKPEITLSNIYLQISLQTSKASEVVNKLDREFQALMPNYESYPSLVNQYLMRMASKLRDRAIGKIGRDQNSVFISYAHHDVKSAVKAAETLRSVGLAVKIDLEFRNGKGIAPEIEKAMLEATSAILLVTPSYLVSEWASEERAFLMDKRRRKELTLYVIAVGVTDDDLYKKAPLLSGIKNYRADSESFESIMSKVAKEIESDTAVADVQ